MATMRFIGSAASIKKVVTYAFAGTWEATDIVRVAFGSKRYDFVVGSTSIATILTSLVTAWKALDKTLYPEFFLVTPSEDSSSLTLTAVTAGEDFTCTITPLETGGTSADSQTIEGAGTATTGTIATANSGPYNWDIAQNWSGGSVPTSSDTVYVDKPGAWIKYGLSQSSVTLTKLVIGSNCKIGLPEVNSKGYTEYMTKKLAISATTLLVTSSADTIRIDVGSNQTATTMAGSGVLSFVGTHASNTVTVQAGQVEIAYLGGESATVATLKVGGGNVFCGTGATLTTVNADNGNLETNSNITTLNVNKGSVTVAAGAVSQLNQYGGNVYYNTTGTLGGNTLCYGNLYLDKTQVAKTITNPILVYGSGMVSDQYISCSSLVITDSTSNGGSQHKYGTNVKITRVVP